MSRDAIDPEMRRRFAEARKTRVGDTGLRRPALRPRERSLRDHFQSDVGRACNPLDNPHLEPRVSAAERAKATPASVLIAIVPRDPEPTVLVTQRSQTISYPGHWVFPGGRADPGDTSPLHTALREAEEEIGLDPSRLEVIGRLGDYVSHSGFRIAPTVAILRPPFELKIQPREVASVREVELRLLLDSSSYFLYRFQNREDHAHFALDIEGDDILLTGITASICIGLYSELLKTHHSTPSPG
jgi:8-oxo-dGTP pyrophosphatase MutT (NUDIX family)